MNDAARSSDTAPADIDPQPEPAPTGDLLAQRARMGIAAAAIVLTIGNLLSRILGLAREQLAANLFGTGDTMAAFTVADNVQTLLFDLLVSGMLQAALIPVLTRWAVPDTAMRAELRRVSGALLMLVFIAVGLATLIGLVFAPAVVRLMTAIGGEAGSRGTATVQLTEELVRWITPAVLLLGIGTVLMAVLHAIGRPTAPALSVAVRNAVIVLTVLIFSGSLGVKSLALGVVLGAAAMTALQIVPLWRSHALPLPNFDFRQPAVRDVLRLYLPIGLGLLINTIAVVIDRNLAWGAGEDALGAMRYATTLVQLILGLVVAALSLAALPSLSRHFAETNHTAFQTTLQRVMITVTILIVPATFGMAAIAKPAVELLFRHGETDGRGAYLITIALLGYLPGTFFAAYDQVLIFSFYARNNTRTPVLVGILAVLVYFLVALLLVQPWGMIGLVLANSAQFIAHAGVKWYLARRSFYTPDRQFLLTSLYCLAAGALSALVAFALWLALDAAIPSQIGAITRELLLVIIPISTAAAVYLAALWRFGTPEIHDFSRQLKGRLIR